MFLRGNYYNDDDYDEENGSMANETGKENVVVKKPSKKFLAFGVSLTTSIARTAHNE